MIGAASDTLVTSSGQFRHSFEVDLSAVSPEPDQPRRHFDAQDIAALAATMADQGQLQPILLRRDPVSRQRWIIVAGERRYRAALLLGWQAILAIAHEGDPEVTALIENLQRVDLSPVEEARGLQRLISSRGWSQDRVAAALGRSKGDVSATLGILTLPETLLDAVLTSELSLSKNLLVELARVEEPTVRAALIARASQGGLTVRGIRQARADGQGTVVSTPLATPSERLPMAAIYRLAARLGDVATLEPGEREALEVLHAAIDGVFGKF